MMYRWALLCLFFHGFLVFPGRAAELVISEFMADNETILVDEDGDFEDWIEIYNASASTVMLNGWHLTDNSNNLTKWTFPNVSLDAGEFIVVFASGKNKVNPANPLHTNFRLANDGEYLAIVRPNEVVCHDYAPEYPPQDDDVSYGIVFEGLRLVRADGGVDMHVPSNAVLGTTWTQPSFMINETNWLDGILGVGYGLLMPGLSVTFYKSAITINNVGEAETLIATPANQTYATNELAALINYHDTGNQGRYGSSNPFPSLNIGSGENNYVIEATAIVVIPSAGDWSFGVNSDDGFSLDLDNGTDSFNVSWPANRGAADTIDTFNITQPGAYNLRLVYFERTGGAEVELYAAPGAHGSWNGTDFDLVGDTANGGLEVFTAAGGPVGGVIGTDVRGIMQGINSGIYLRMPFTVNDSSTFDSLSLNIEYNDGFVAYLNGTQVASRNAPGGPLWNSSATATQDVTQSLTVEPIDLTASIPLLQNGSSNVLALHGLNVSAADNSFRIVPELAVGGLQLDQTFYFATPSANMTNTLDYFGKVEDTKFSVDRGFYTNAFTVAITTETVGATIRYTLDCTEPTESSGLIYTNPVSVTNTTILRAMAFKPGFQSTDIDTQTYIFLDDILQQSASPPGFETYTTWSGVSADYEVDPDIANDPQYSSQIRSNLLAIPSVSIVA
ncbi:MAG: chitobiase/beta-hexosaminidase C-terminal domain-containing protein, partial [Verrucomicrobiota bacterium]